MLTNERTWTLRALALACAFPAVEAWAQETLVAPPPPPLTTAAAPAETPPVEQQTAGLQGVVRLAETGELIQGASVAPPRGNSR